MADRQVAIVLQGGGALGAYELGVLKRLYEQNDFRPAIVSGVSIGAITAAVLVGAKQRDPIASLAALWEEFEIFSSPFLPDQAEGLFSMLGNPPFYRPRIDYFRMSKWTSFYDTSPLQRTVQKYVDFGRIAASDIQLILTATDVKTGQRKVFDNRAAGPLGVEHVLASASLPPGFPPTPIHGEMFWDGGLFDNTPLSPVIKALDPAREAQLIVVNLFPARADPPKSLMQVFSRTVEIIFSNKMQDDVELALEVSDYVALVEAIKKVPELAALVSELDGFKRLNRYKLLRNVVYITNKDKESPTAFFDFSRAAIERRIESGYRDADKALDNPITRAAEFKSIKTTG